MKNKPMTVGQLREKLAGFDQALPIMTLKDIDFNQYRVGPPIELIEEIDIFDKGDPLGHSSFILNSRSPLQLFSSWPYDNWPTGKAIVIWQ